LARLAASAALTLLPYHRTHVSPQQLAKTIHRYLALVRLPPVITHLALMYLYRVVKAGFPVHNYTVQQLFVVCYALADIYLDDNAYSNKSWLQVLNDGTPIREWSRMEMQILGLGLKHRLEVGDREWKRWCEWLGEWWTRVGEKEWELIDAQRINGGHAARTMSVDAMVGWSANVKKRMSQMAEYEWDKNCAEEEACSDYGESEQDWDEDDESEEEEEPEEQPEPQPRPPHPVLRKKDSGYCGTSPHSDPKARAHGTINVSDDDEMGEMQVEATAATKYAVKRATVSFKWKWMF